MQDSTQLAMSFAQETLTAPPPPTDPAFDLVPHSLRKQLNANWRRSINTPPVLKIFNPSGAATWLIHSADPHEPSMLFGLCDLGMGFPELGYVDLDELRELRIPVRLIINGEHEITTQVQLERDLHFNPTHTLETYADAAHQASGITENAHALRHHADRNAASPKRRTRRTS